MPAQWERERVSNPPCRSLKKIISALTMAIMPVLNVFLIMFLLMGICAPPARR